MASHNQIRILCVDDHAIVREGLNAVISAQPDLSVIAEASSGEEAIELYRQHRPDIVLMDLRLKGASGLEATIAIREEFPQARIIMLTTYDGDEDIHRALDAGAQGYLLKDTLRKELVDVIRGVHAGQRRIPSSIAVKLAEHMPRLPLSAREIEILKLIAQGLRNKQVGGMLNIAEDTVKVHVKNIFDKLDVHDRTQAVTVALQRGIIHLDY
ncbi:MAG: response regulator transcription factor [Acidobacteriota bacterium]